MSCAGFVRATTGSSEEVSELRATPSAMQQQLPGWSVADEQRRLPVIMAGHRALSPVSSGTAHDRAAEVSYKLRVLVSG